MGFEVLYKYHDKKEDGNGYNLDEQLEMKKKVGKPYDDTSYQKLAAAIMGQLARRDIMVIDVDIVELVKKEINFRETKNGIIIKNKKYLFGNTEAEIEEVDEEENCCNQNINYANNENIEKGKVQQKPIEQKNVPTNVNIAPKVQSSNLPNKKTKPLRYEHFDPHPDLMADLRKRNLKFTMGQKYPIYEEKQDNRGVMYGMLYTTVDDEGNRQILTDKLFTFRTELKGGNQFADNNNVPLNYGSTTNMDMPKIR